MEGVDYLADERRKAEFDVDSMKIVWAGSKHAFDLADRISTLVAVDPVFQKDNRAMLSRKDLFKNTLRKAAYAFKRVNELNLNQEEAAKLRYFIDEPTFMDLHWNMFVPAIKGQGTEEQQEKWLPLAEKMQIIGCYAQTELGHGSNIQGLETTSTFDPTMDEFVIHSPTLTSSKWWPGGLGKVSTHAVVYARLITEGQDHGVHGFIVQLRSLEDHLPLPGITVGDIGTKFGNGAYNTMDNGVLRFDHVRIPRNQMLMRVLQVSREGKCTYSDVPRQLVYGTMVYVRQTIVTGAARALSRAVTIATRYSCVRRQFGSQNGGPETQVIDYKTQQNRLFPLLASAYAFKFVAEWLEWLYNDVTDRLKANDFSTLQEAHACTAGLKSLTTSAATDAIEECRKLCGGHGYLCSSGLPELFAVYVPACTYEGDNIVLLLQVARFLVKTVSQLGSGTQPVGTTAYMGRAEHLMQCRCNVERAEDWLKPRAILEAFEARAIRMAVSCNQSLEQFPNPEEGFAELSADLAEVAVAHCELIVVSKFIDKLKQEIPGKGVKRQLQFLGAVYALYLLHKHQGEFLATGCITAEQASLATTQLRNLYSKVRPNAVALVDSFNYTDHYLNSTLGRYDGNVYPKLYEAAWKDPLNDTVVVDGYVEYIKPFLEGQLDDPVSTFWTNPFWTEPNQNRGDGEHLTLYEKQKDLPTYMLFESYLGYALFRTHHVCDTQRNYRAIEKYINRFDKVFECIAYHLFESADEALMYLNAASNDTVPMHLIDFLVHFLPKPMKGGENCYTLALPQSATMHHIVVHTKIVCSRNLFHDQIMRGVRMHIDTFFEDMKRGDLEKAQLDLVRNYCRQRLISPGMSQKKKGRVHDGDLRRKNPLRKCNAAVKMK